MDQKGGAVMSDDETKRLLSRIDNQLYDTFQLMMVIVYFMIVFMALGILILVRGT